VTVRHCCGRCKEYGHGKCECTDIDLRKSLNQFNNDVMPENLRCSFQGCLDPQTHTTSSHTCLYCNKPNLPPSLRGPFGLIHMKRCPIKDKDYGFTRNEAETMFDMTEFSKYNLERGQFVNVYSGMGCCTFIRCNKDDNILEYMFLHSDSQGQYGEDSSDIPKLNAFIYGYKNVTIN